MSANTEKLSTSLQFDSAEMAAGSPAGSVCAQCQKPIDKLYYEAGGNAFCASCARVIKTALDSSFDSKRFARGALFGFGGALAGALVYYGILAATGYEVGLVAILVGFLVGWTVRRGAGRGGRSYQILALSLTYLAIGATYMSFALKESFGSKAGQTEVADSSISTAATTLPNRAAVSTVSSDSATADIQVEPVHASRFFMALAGLIGLTFAMPVLYIVSGLPSSLISGLIMFFGLRQAWAMNRVPPVTVTGPFQVASRPAGPAPGTG